MFKHGLWLLAIICLLPHAPAQAQIYRCEVNGRKVYQDIPCDGSLGDVGDSIEERQRQKQLEKLRREEQALRQKQAELKGFEIERFYSLTSFAARVVLKVYRPMVIQCAVLNSAGEYQTVETFRVTPPAHEGQFLVDEYLAKSVSCWER